MQIQTSSILKNFLIWRIKNISQQNFIVFISIIIGLLSGLAAVLIKNSVFILKYILTIVLAINYHNYLFFIYPAIGIFIAILFMKYVFKEYLGHGVPQTLYAISKENGIIKPHHMVSSIIASVFTVGFGGSVGLEGPAVGTSAAIGSNLGKTLRLNYKQIVLLIGCGCASAMAAMFKAPIAGVVFALEVIMLDLKMSSLVPLLISSVTAVLTSYLLTGHDVLYVPEIDNVFNFKHIPFYLLFAIAAGLVSLYFTKVYIYIESIFSKIKSRKKRFIIGSLFLGGLIFLLPPLYGEGYSAINACIKGDFSYLFNNTYFYHYKDNTMVVLLVLLLISAFKIVASGLTFGTGGIGGIFAPALFTGAFFGFFFSKAINYYFNIYIPEYAFGLVGMAGLISGTMHAPLTAIFIIAEITDGYNLFLPLMIVATISYATIRLFVSNSVQNHQLAQKGQLLTHDRDKAVLTMMKMDSFIETNFVRINPNTSLGEIIEIISKSNHNIFPVIDDNNNLCGAILLDHIRPIMFKHELYESIKATDLMITISEHIDYTDTMEQIADKFQESEYNSLPVLHNRRFVGFISRDNVFLNYRKILKNYYEDTL